MKTAKKIANWTIPPNVYSLLKQTKSEISSRFFMPNEVKKLFNLNKKFKNIHKGKRCFILATGPSINKQDLKILQDEICISVSYFFLHKDIKYINPAYHVEAPNHHPFDFEAFDKIFAGIKKNYTDKTTCFFGYKPYKYSILDYLKIRKDLQKDNYCYLDYSQSIQIDERNYDNPNLWDICKPLFGARTVVYSAINIAAYMGFSEIYLLGCDHNYLEDYSKQETSHFYDLKDGISDHNDWRKFNTEYLFYTLYLRWKQYRLIAEYLSAKRCSIYNATAGGCLDVFKRIKLEDIIKNNI
ncbi:MAG: 6-hydroxymethylpterin diphosphokinase MptE-like protein [Pseudomonadota bacterium]